MLGNERRLGLGVVAGFGLLMSMFSVGVIPTSVEAAITAQWTLGTPLNETLSEVVVVTDESGLVYVVGGMNTADYDTVSNASTYDVDTGEWRDLADLPQPTRGAAGAYLDGKVYVFGGYDTGTGWLDNTQIYDVATDTWSSGTALPQRLWQSKAGVGSDGLIYVFGGKNPGYVYTNTVYIYDPAVDSWSSGTNMPVGTSGGAVVSDGYSFYYIGGHTASGTTDDVYQYYTWGSWYTMAPLPRATEALAAVEGADGLLYAFGGSNSESEVGLGYNWTYFYDPWDDVWHDGPNMTYMPRYLGGVSTGDGRVFAFGGAIDSGLTSAVSSMRIMSVSASVDPTVVQTGRPVLVTVSVDFANVDADWYYGYAALESGSGTSYSSVDFRGPFDITFAFAMEIPEGIAAGAYTIVLQHLEIDYELDGGTEIAEQSLPLGIVVGETLDEQVQSLLDEIADLEGQLAAQDGNVTLIAAQLAALGSYLTSLQSQLDDMQDQVDRIEDKADSAGMYAMINVLLVVVVVVLLAVMFVMTRKKP